MIGRELIAADQVDELLGHIEEVPVELEPGDVAFFAGRTLHRSHANRSATRRRRSFVGRYCNARSFVP